MYRFSLLGRCYCALHPFFESCNGSWTVVRVYKSPGILRGLWEHFVASGCLTGTVPVGSGQVLTVCIRRGGFDTGLVDDLLLSNMPSLCGMLDDIGIYVAEDP